MNRILFLFGLVAMAAAMVPPRRGCSMECMEGMDKAGMKKCKMMEMAGMKDGKMDEEKMKEMMDEMEGENRMEDMEDMRRKEDDEEMNMEEMKKMKKMMETCNTVPCMKEAKAMCKDMKDEMDDMKDEMDGMYACKGCIEGFMGDGGCEGVALLFEGEMTPEQLGESVPEECLPCSDGAAKACFDMWGDQCEMSCDECKEVFLDNGGCMAMTDAGGLAEMGLGGECDGCEGCADLSCMLGYMEENNISPMEMAMMINSDDKKGVHSPKFSHFK